MNPDDSPITRRELVESAIRASLAPGGIVFFNAWLKAQEHSHQPEAKPLSHYEPQFFQADDFEALQAFTEILIPTDETAGAREAQCAHYIDFVLSASGETPQIQAGWRSAMQALKEAGFHRASASHRLQIVSQLAQYELSPATADNPPPTYSAYKLIKQQSIFAFYTSRAGMIEALDYKGNSYNVTFPGCDHAEHKTI